MYSSGAYRIRCAPLLLKGK
ncbi:MAG: hypothetical protein CVU72_05225 [Deltaproteobacteria bacterium HGW-Deltaproteobacteria-7]|nr:MAG: hypothetical protein CVU72_05225 [Deltaproteobacteria bacterium HGW-Deltaproteobacteria-7]